MTQLKKYLDFAEQTFASLLLWFFQAGFVGGLHYHYYQGCEVQKEEIIIITHSSRLSKQLCMYIVIRFWLWNFQQDSKLPGTKCSGPKIAQHSNLTTITNKRLQLDIGQSKPWFLQVYV